MGKPKKGFDIDHINGDGLDNRKSNLRICKHGENQYNSKMPKNNTSGYKGVYWDKRRNKWISQININGKHVYIGQFINAIDAANAYDKAAMQYHKEFAKPNSNYQ